MEIKTTPVFIAGQKAAYAEGTSVKGGSGLVLLSGVVGIDCRTGQIPPGMYEQTILAWETISTGFLPPTLSGIPGRKQSAGFHSAGRHQPGLAGIPGGSRSRGGPAVTAKTIRARGFTSPRPAKTIHYVPENISSTRPTGSGLRHGEDFRGVEKTCRNRFCLPTWIFSDRTFFPGH